MKKIFVVIFIFNLSYINLYSAEKKDCSVHKNFSSKYLKCKTGNLTAGVSDKGKSFFKNTIDYQKKAFTKKK